MNPPKNDDHFVLSDLTCVPSVHDIDNITQFFFEHMPNNIVLENYRVMRSKSRMEDIRVNTQPSSFLGDAPH
jgi:hypothetical protein